MQRSCFYNIHTTPKCILYIQSEAAKVEQASICFHIDQQIDVAIAACFSACD